MKNILNKIKTLFGKTPAQRFYSLTNIAFVATILISSLASLFHVRGFWMVTNSYFWATSLAIATGLGIIGSMMASKYTLLTYISFGIIIIMELFGNIFDAFMYIDVTSRGFIAWKNLVSPLFELIYIPDVNGLIPDIIYMRWIACIQGAFIPLLVAIVFHMWMKIRKSYKHSKENEKTSENPNNSPVEDDNSEDDDIPEETVVISIEDKKKTEAITPVEPKHNSQEDYILSSDDIDVLNEIYQQELSGDTEISEGEVEETVDNAFSEETRSFINTFKDIVKDETPVGKMQNVSFKGKIIPKNGIKLKNQKK